MSEADVLGEEDGIPGVIESALVAATDLIAEARYPEALGDVLIHHYTTAEGALGILRAREFWASDVRFLNDSREWLHAIELMRDVLAQEELSGALALAMDYGIDVLQGRRAFATCFSADGDSLSQWRAYAGRGYSLTFDASELRNALPYGLNPVIYDEAKKREIVAAFLRAIRLHAQQRRSQPDAIAECVQTLLAVGPYVATVLKHQSFESERESRLHCRVDPKAPIETRVRDGYFLPFRRLSFAEVLPKSITVGPSPHPDVSIAGVEALLAELGLEKQIEVKASRTPYRDWW